jgi:hypothetical protein
MLEQCKFKAGGTSQSKKLNGKGAIKMIFWVFLRGWIY